MTIIAFTPGVRRYLGRLLGSWLGRRGSTVPRPPGDPRKRAVAAGNVLVSPWRVYRLYARAPHLLLRDVQGKVVDLGVVRGAEPDFSYRLNTGGVQGKGFATLGLLLDDVSLRIRTAYVEGELRRLPDCSMSSGVDLDRSTYLDVSLNVDHL